MYWPYAATSGLIMSPGLLFVCLRTAAEHHPPTPLTPPLRRGMVTPAGRSMCSHKYQQEEEEEGVFLVQDVMEI